MLLKEGDLMIDMLRLTHIQITTANIEISVIDKLNYIRDISERFRSYVAVFWA